MCPVAAASTADDTVENTPAKDDDPDGVKLLGAADGLDRAAKLLQPLESLAASNIDAWLVIYDVAVRRSKLSTVMTFIRRLNQV